MSAHHCTVTQQGYPGLRTVQTSCLSHTGFDLLPLLVGVVIILVAGSLLRYVGRSK